MTTSSGLTLSFAGLSARLQKGEIHIHLLRWKEGPEVLLPFLPLLASTEQSRYFRLGTPERRTEFLGSRLLVQGLLAGYGNENGGELEWKRGEKGKPFVESSAPRFNLSHKGGLTACSLGWGEVGIDVEQTRRSGQVDWPLLSRRFFSPRELDYLYSQPSSLRPIIFLKIFTRKEAVVKCSGEGLSFPLSGFTVPLPPEGTGRDGSLEYLTLMGEEGFCLSHVAWNPEHHPLRYRFYHWDEGILVGALEESRRGRLSPWK